VKQLEGELDLEGFKLEMAEIVPEKLLPESFKRT
jgi:hypothetical protein